MDTVVAVETHIESHHSNISPNPLKCPPTPLHPLSPERINQQRIPQSPSVHSYLMENERPRTRDSVSSDVQSKVAFLNSLATGASVQSSPTRPGRLGGAFHPNGNATPNNNGHNNSNALQRAVMGYEEAQASLATLNAELEQAREELASRKKRERMLSQRVEELLEALQAEKEKRGRDQESYTKEIKRCRKETYRAELAVVEVRQDLQEARGEVKRYQAETTHERAEKEKSRQEAFERAYALAGMVGEMEQLKDRLKVVEKERDTALLDVKANAVEKSAMLDGEKVECKSVPKEEEGPMDSRQENEGGAQSISTLRPTLEGVKMLEPPSFAPTLPSFDSLRRQLNYYDKQMEGAEILPEEEIEFLKQELTWARRKHVEDEELIHFMHMQCQFKACPCQMAEINGDRFVHDHVYDANLQQQRMSKKRKISNEIAQSPSAVQESTDFKLENPATGNGTSSEDTPIPEAQPAEEETVSFPPEPSPECLVRVSEVPALEEAMGVPLPEPQPMELDPKDDTPEPTAQLEEITQVLVEPGTASKPFSFSTSTTSNPTLRATAPSLRHAESASTVLENDLFDLSPPKQAPPRRPSTAMGILTIDSPIRLVPDSPRSICGRERNHTLTQSITTTTKIALKDSPPQNSLHRRAQSRPNLRSHSPLVSSVMSQDDDSAAHLQFANETSASPAANTVFPITPLHKHSRSMHNLAQHAQSQSQLQHRSPPQTIATTTTTTRVPLRGFGDADDVFSPDHGKGDAYGHAHTENLNFNMGMHSRTSATNSETSSQRQVSQTSTLSTSHTSASTLFNVPGTPISREAALAQIRARRDRARSVNLKKSLEGSGKENANSGGAKSPTKPRVVNGIRGVGAAALFGKENVRRDISQISQASAPGRFAF